MIGIIEIDEEDVSDDRHIILEFPIEPERNGMQTVMRVKTNIKLQPEIIRCKDCKHRNKDGECGQYDDGTVAVSCEVPDDHYCGYAERRTDEPN